MDQNAGQLDDWLQSVGSKLMRASKYPKVKATPLPVRGSLVLIPQPWVFGFPVKARAEPDTSYVDGSVFVIPHHGGKLVYHLYPWAPVPFTSIVEIESKSSQKLSLVKPAAAAGAGAEGESQLPVVPTGGLVELVLEEVPRAPLARTVPQATAMHRTVDATVDKRILQKRADLIIADSLDRFRNQGHPKATNAG